MTQMTRRMFLAAGGATLSTAAIAAPASRLIDGPWTRFGSGGDPDYTQWSRFLETYLVTGTDGIARVRYQKARQDGQRLTAILGAMQQVDPTRLSKGTAMSYWINLYNILTIDLVIEAGAVSSIKEVRGGIFNTGP